MKLLVVGSGGREHALAAGGWPVARASRRSMSRRATPARRARTGWRTLHHRHRRSGRLRRARTDHTSPWSAPRRRSPPAWWTPFRAKNLPIFGPTREAAQLESSKDFAKRFMQRHKIPTAPSPPSAIAEERTPTSMREGAPIVIKADGLAAGKGVVVAMDSAEAHAAIDMMLTDNKMGDAGARVVIEEFLEGEEASFIVMCDGRHALPLATSQDHKRLRTATRVPTPAAWAPIRRRRW
jgi:phosphoribosylamine--glycine ligase